MQWENILRAINNGLLTFTLCIDIKKLDQGIRKVLGVTILLTVNSLMFAGINICVFEAKPCSRGLIFAFSSSLVSYLHTLSLFAGYLFLRFRDSRKIRQINPSKSLMNLQCIEILKNSLITKPTPSMFTVWHFVVAYTFMSALLNFATIQVVVRYISLTAFLILFTLSNIPS